MSRGDDMPLCGCRTADAKACELLWSAEAQREPKFPACPCVCHRPAKPKLQLVRVRD
jgi:hypothetical protein